MPVPDSVATITVSVPSRADHVHVLRAVTASVAARLRMPYDAIEDLRLAVDEACAWLLMPRSDAGPIVLRLRLLDDRLEAVVSIDDAERVWPPADVERSLSWQILSALVDSIEVDAAPPGPSIRLSKRTLESTPKT